MTTADLDALAKTQTESRGTVAYEFDAGELGDAPFTPRMRDQLAARAAGRRPEQTGPATAGPVKLAYCLLAQGRVLLALGRVAEAAAALSEATRLGEAADFPPALAECYHLLAAAHEARGELDAALALLRREEEMRRRFAA